MQKWNKIIARKGNQNQAEPKNKQTKIKYEQQPKKKTKGNKITICYKDYILNNPNRILSWC